MSRIRVSFRQNLSLFLGYILAARIHIIVAATLQLCPRFLPILAQNHEGFLDRDLLHPHRLQTRATPQLLGDTSLIALLIVQKPPVRCPQCRLSE
jgi:hypothetical protein